MLHGGRQVGCITCGVEMVSPNTRYPHCSGGNLPPTGPEGRSRGTFVSATAKPETPVIPTVAQAEWRNPPRGRKYQRKVKSATWEDSSTPFHYARNDISGGDSIQPHRLYSQRSQPLAGAGWRWVNAATFVPYIGLYHSPTQVIIATWRAAGCRPYGNVPRFTVGDYNFS